jgi:hypothetical protein
MKRRGKAVKVLVFRWSRRIALRSREAQKGADCSRAEMPELEAPTSQSEEESKEYSQDGCAVG